MYKLLGDAVETALALKSFVANANHCEIVIAPVAVHLKTISDRLEGSNIKVAAQNCAAELAHGAHTGEIAADMLREVGCSHIIIGHSERRQFYGDTDDLVNQKVIAALQENLTAIVCVGENLHERQTGAAHATVEAQINKSLYNLTSAQMNRIIIAYEPVWAIGTGQVASPEQAQEMHGFIRQTVENQHSTQIARSVRILYGGSVKPNNIKGLMAQTDIDGALVGGASLDAASFAEIVNYQ